MARFPGMDPFLEGELWEDFHTSYIAALRAWLVPHLRGRYIVVIERRVYIEHPRESQPALARPDVAVVKSAVRREPAAKDALPALRSPTLARVPIAMPEEVEEPYITIRLRDTREVVTVIELLSPSNKRHGSDGRREYLGKRDDVLRSGSHLVEIDLLRGGDRMPMAGPLPAGDYYVIVSRVAERPQAEVWSWMLPDPLPTVSVPLAEGAPDVPLQLQEAFEEIHRRAAYDEILDYRQPLQPSPSPEEQSWIAAILGS